MTPYSPLTCTSRRLSSRETLGKRRGTHAEHDAMVCMLAIDVEVLVINDAFHATLREHYHDNGGHRLAASITWPLSH